MTLTDAAASIGAPVSYRAHPDADPETGVITSTNARWVFVRYGRDACPKATAPELLSPVEDVADWPDGTERCTCGRHLPCRHCEKGD